MISEMMSNITGFGQATPPAMQGMVHSAGISKDACVKIIEQPAENKLRFR